MANVKQIKIGNTTYDIEALHFITGNLDSPAQWKNYIDSLVGQGLQIVIDTQKSGAEEPATAASASTMGKLYMVNITGQTAGTYTEFVTIDKGASANPRYVWEKIGTTQTDLTAYAKKTEAAKPGSYTSCYPTMGGTGSLSGCVYTDTTHSATFTTSSSGSQTATGTVSVTGPCFSATESAGSAATENTSSSSGSTQSTTGTGGGFTIQGCNFSFSGNGHVHRILGDDVASVIENHSYTPAGSIGGSQQVNGHTHTVSGHATNCFSLISCVSTGTVVEDTSVSDGVLSFSTRTVVTDVSHAEDTPQITGSAESAGSHTISGSNFTFTGTAATLTHTSGTDSCIYACSTTVSGTITGSQTVSDHSHSYSAPANHTHTYVPLPAHTHAITVNTTTYTGTASVAVSNHTHTVDIGNHRHDVSHKHDIIVDPISNS